MDTEVLDRWNVLLTKERETARVERLDQPEIDPLRIELFYVLEEQNLAPRFRRAARSGPVRLGRCPPE